MATTLRQHEMLLPEPLHPLSNFEMETLQTVTSNEVTGLDRILSNAKAYFNHDMQCEISSSHGGEYDDQNCLLGCTAV
jgi:hypothetical protein